MKLVKNREVFLACLYVVVSEIIFGLSFIFTKLGLEEASPLALLGWRFLLAFVVMLVMVGLGIVKVELNLNKLKRLVPIAMLNPVIYYAAETVGVRLTTVSETGSIIACLPVVCLLASSLILGNRPTGRQVLGVLTSLAGVLVSLLAAGTSSSFSLLGYLALGLAILSYAIYSVLIEGGHGSSSEEMTLVMLMLGALVFSSLALIEAMVKGQALDLISLPLRSKGFLISICYQAIFCSVIAFFLVNQAIATIGVNKTSSFVGVSTLVSIIAGVLIMGDDFGPVQALGSLAIITGVYIANSQARPQPQQILDKD